MEDEPQLTRLRRRERTGLMERVQQTQQEMEGAQQRLNTYEEAQGLLEESITHTTVGERALVEYYLALEDLLQSDDLTDDKPSPRQEALMDVQHRVEHVSAPYEED